MAKQLAKVLRRKARARVAALTAALALTGCSFMTMERVKPSDSRQVMPTCTASVLPILADALGVMFWSGSIIASSQTALDDSNTDDEKKDGLYGALAFTGVALLHVGSGYWGYHARERCNRARDAHEERLQRLPRIATPPVGRP